MAAWVAPAIAAGGSILGGLLSSKGNNSDVGYAQSPEQRQIYGMAQPALQRMFNGGNFYNIPDAVAPTQDWYNNISGEVKAGMMAPYQDMSNQLTESMGHSAGSAGAGASGMLGASQAKFWSQAGKDYGMNLWNMTSPGMMANWNAELERSRMPYTGALGAVGGTYSQPVVSAPQTTWQQGVGAGLSNISNTYLMNKLFSSNQPANWSGVNDPYMG